MSEPQPKDGAGFNIPLRHWLAAAQAGSPDALGRLFELCRDYLLEVANGELESDLLAKAGASDLVQDTFLEAQRDFPQFAGKSPEELRGWLRRILLNNLANFSRAYHDAAKRDVGREVSLDDRSSAGNLYEHGLSGSTSPSGKAMKREQEEALRRAVDQLPAHYRQVVLWRHRDNLSVEEIAQRLGRTPAAVRMVYERATDKLHTLLEPSE